MFLSADTRLYGVPSALSRAAALAFADVETLPGVCARWGKSRKSVLMRIYRGDFEAIQSGKVWLIYVPSVRKFWGEPQESDN